MRPHIGWIIKTGTVYPYVAACVGIYYGRVKCQEYAEATQEDPDTIVLGADPNRKATLRSTSCRSSSTVGRKQYVDKETGHVVVL
jgi:hypothetical protein